MDKDKLKELESLAKEATPGPWFVTCNCTGKTFYTIKNDRVYIGETLGVYNGETNAAYIVAACNNLPALIAENRALQERVADYSAELAVLLGCKHDLEKQVQELEEHAAYLETVNSDLIAEMNGCMAKVADLERELKAALERC